MTREALLKIQRELKAPKNQYNNFGQYKYRSCEDILEAVKPLLEKYSVTLTISDTVEYIGDRYYVSALATITDGTEPVSVRAYARESDVKKGMDSSQITGTASSYARKYALNGLFLIDDAKDADTDDYKRQTGEKQPEAERIPMASEKQLNYIKKLATENPVKQEYLRRRVTDWKNLTMREATEIIEDLKG